MSTDSAKSDPQRASARRRGRPWILAAVLAGVIVAGGVLRWDQAPTHNAVALFSRTTTDGVRIDVERGDVRWSPILCADGQFTCTQRSPGVLVRFAFPDGRSEGGAAFPDDLGSVARATASCLPDDESPPVRIVTTAGLGTPPGSTDEAFVFARTSPAVATVRAVRDNGTVDEMAPVDNIVVLATRTGFSARDHVQAFDAQGRLMRVC